MSVRRTALAAAATALGVALSVAGTSAAQAGSTHHSAAAHSARAGATYLVPTGGKTTLALNAGTASALTGAGVTVAPASSATAGSAGISFPIRGGYINAKTLGGKITHSGGLTFSAGGKSLTIRDFTVNTSKKVLTAWVDELNTRVQVLNVNLAKAKVKVTSKRLTITNVRTTLQQGVADALNAYFSTTLFSGGLKIGTVSVSAPIKVLHR
jgi:hypothetical protein